MPQGIADERERKKEMQLRREKERTSTTIRSSSIDDIGNVTQMNPTKRGRERGWLSLNYEYVHVYFAKGCEIDAGESNAVDSASQRLCLHSCIELSIFLQVRQVEPEKEGGGGGQSFYKLMRKMREREKWWGMEKERSISLLFFNDGSPYPYPSSHQPQSPVSAYSLINNCF